MQSRSDSRDFRHRDPLQGDDLRTRSEASGFRMGVGAEGRERREDGADDHPNDRQLEVCAWGSSRRKHSLPRRSRIKPGC